MNDYIHCPVCGKKLIDKYLKNEGDIPFCPSCEEFRFPRYNVAVSMIVIRKNDNYILLIKQYSRPDYILVAGYVNRTESLEKAVIRELKEETGMTAKEYHYNRSKFFEKSNTLMCNFTVYVDNDNEMKPNEEIDEYAWFQKEEARGNIRPNSLAKEFLEKFLEET